MKYAWGLLVLTIGHYYAYYALPGVPVRVYSALGGFHILAMSLAMCYLIFNRLTDWRVSVVLMMSLTITVVESLFIAVCGSWYAFIYTGPPIFVDKCDVMTGTSMAKPIFYTLATLSLIILPRIWNKSWLVRENN